MLTEREGSVPFSSLIRPVFAVLKLFNPLQAKQANLVRRFYVTSYFIVNKVDESHSNSIVLHMDEIMQLTNHCKTVI